VERVLPDPTVKERLQELAVGLAADCDAPEHDVEKIMHENLKGANMLPFVGFITHDGKWVGGFSGYKDTAEFVKVLAAAEETPYLQATKAVRAKLATLSGKATKAAEQADWKTVVAVAKDAAKTTGRCPERTAIVETMKKAQAWAAGRIDEAVKAAQAGNVAPANDALAEVRKCFLGEPEGADAETGIKALKRLSTILEAEAKGMASPSSREKAKKEFAETRWTAIFDETGTPSGPNEDGVSGSDG
jgi:hypothetical protein